MGRKKAKKGGKKAKKGGKKKKSFKLYWCVVQPPRPQPPEPISRKGDKK